MARVLLADSQPLFNEALEALFAREGVHNVVGCAATADQAVRLARQQQPDLLMVDAELALQGRPNLLERVRAACGHTRALVLGDEQDICLVFEVIKSGAYGVVAKTRGAATVMRSVRAVLDGEGVVSRSLLPELFRRLLEANERAARSPLSRLSPRERQVLALLSRGWDNNRIGRELYISPHTVRTHIQNILAKLEMHSKLEAATFAMQDALDLIAPPRARHRRDGNLKPVEADT